MAIPTSCFTVTASGLLNELVTQCQVLPAFDGSTAPAGHPPPVEFKALWDTGATNSCISQSVVDACGLKPMGMANVHTANGPCRSEVYLINLRLPNNVGFRNVRVTNQELLGAPVIIGMDVISQGDFAVTNLNRKTKFSFRFPSRSHIDFVDEINRAKAAAFSKVGRNDPCPCGSGKKSKKCHGKGFH